MRFSTLFLAILALQILASCSSYPTQAEKNFEEYWQAKLHEPVEVRKPAGLLDRVFPGLGKVLESKEAKPFLAEELIAAASSEKLELRRARVLIDNDDAFRAKLEAIRSAEPGEAIRIAYYIFSPDQSSAMLYQEMVRAAKRGVKVKILADLLTNYTHLDLFRLLTQEGGGNIDVRFFGRPSRLILRDMKFLTMPCPPASQNPSPTFCADAKWSQVRPPYETQDFYGKALLSGALAKSAPAVKVGVLMGQQLDLAALRQGSGNAKPEERKQLLEFLELVARWKILGDDTAAIKAKMALSLYGAQLNPIMNEVFGRIPLHQIGESSSKDWEHVTDFTHHKMLLVGDRFLQLGGRNIENSYHMKPNPLIHRYVFKDIDVAVEIARGGGSIGRSFEDLFQFAPTSVRLADLETMAPNDFVENTKAFEAVAGACLQQKLGRAEFAACVERELPKHADFRSRDQRLAKLKEELAEGVRAYEVYAAQPRERETWSMDGSEEIAPRELAQATVVYLENVPYNRQLPAASRTRVYGAQHGSDRESGKYIHYAWSRGLQNACVTAQKSGKETRVLLHSAYYLPPANMLQDLTKMFDGTWNCKNVRVTILSNSFSTTDLNVINLFGQYQMTAFFYLYSKAEELFPESKGRRAKIEYYEYRKFAAGDSISLHKKIHLMGNDVFLGSANGDVRSYYMDTNNGLYFQNVPQFAQAYTAWVDGLLKDKALTIERTQDFAGPGKTVDNILLSLHREDVKKVEQFLSARGWDKKLSAEVRASLYEKADMLGRVVYQMTRQIMSTKYINGESEAEKQVEQSRIADRYNRLLQLL